MKHSIEKDGQKFIEVAELRDELGERLECAMDSATSIEEYQGFKQASDIVEDTIADLQEK